MYFDKNYDFSDRNLNSFILITVNSLKFELPNGCWKLPLYFDDITFPTSFMAINITLSLPRFESVTPIHKINWKPLFMHSLKR